MADEKNDIERYHNGSMSPAERHAMEKKALNDPFLSDAMEGASTISSKEFSADLQELSKKIRTQSPRVWFTPLRIAASIVFMIAAGATFYFLNPLPTAQLALLHAAQPLNTADSMVVPLSAPTLLTMAKPLEPSIDKKESVAQSVTSQANADKNSLPNNVNSGGGVTAEIQGSQAQSQPASLSTQEEEKSKIASSETSDDNLKVDELAPAASGASGSNKKENRTLRAAKMTTAQKPNEKFLTITGKVSSVEDGSALPGVDVILKGADAGTITDAQGQYQVSTQVANPQFVFSLIGKKTIEATAQQLMMDVQLSEDVSNLSDVVVKRKESEGNGLDALGHENIVKMALPVGGLSAYHKYLADNLRYPPEVLANKIKGKVTIQFTVTPKGSLTAFIVLTGLGHACEDEVMRLVQEGPLWIPSTENNIPFESEVKVMMRFDPEKRNR